MFQAVKLEFALARDIISPMIVPQTLDNVANLHANLQSNTAITPLSNVLIGGFTIDGLFRRLARLKSMDQPQTNDDLDEMYEQICNAVQAIAEHRVMFGAAFMHLLDPIYDFVEKYNNRFEGTRQWDSNKLQLLKWILGEFKITV